MKKNEEQFANIFYSFCRTVRFSVLGMSLSSLLDISAPHDFLRGLLSLMQEFDAVTDDKFERKNVSLRLIRLLHCEERERELIKRLNSLATRIIQSRIKTKER